MTLGCCKTRPNVVGFMGHLTLETLHFSWWGMGNGLTVVLCLWGGIPHNKGIFPGFTASITTSSSQNKTRENVCCFKHWYVSVISKKHIRMCIFPKEIEMSGFCLWRGTPFWVLFLGPKLFQIMLAGPASKSVLRGFSEKMWGLLQNDQQDEADPICSKINQKVIFFFNMFGQFWSVWSL